MSADLIKNWLVLGSVYLLFSNGFSIVFGAFNVMNLAHGAILTLGAFIGIYADNVLGVPIAVTLVLAAIGAGVTNSLLDAFILRPIARRTADASDYTHIRWVLKAPLDAGAKGFARFSAVVR